MTVLNITPVLPSDIEHELHCLAIRSYVGAFSPIFAELVLAGVNPGHADTAIAMTLVHIPDLPDLDPEPEWDHMYFLYRVCQRYAPDIDDLFPILAYLDWHDAIKDFAWHYAALIATGHGHLFPVHYDIPPHEWRATYPHLLNPTDPE